MLAVYKRNESLQYNSKFPKSFLLISNKTCDQAPAKSTYVNKFKLLKSSNRAPANKGEGFEVGSNNHILYK